MAEVHSNSHANPAFDAGEDDIKENDTSKEAKKEYSSTLIYNIEDIPPWHLSTLLGFQHYLTMVGSTIALPVILAPALCIKDDDPILGVFISTILFVSGMVTFLQATVGTRLPIIQGGSFAFVISTLAILNSLGSCESDLNLPGSDYETVWITRVREMQGAIMVASIFQVMVGASGFIGWMLTWISPLSIVPTITLVGLALSKPAVTKASGSWPIAIMTAIILTLFSQFLGKIKVKLPMYKKKQGLVFKDCAIFALFPILLGLSISWGIAGILTVVDVLPVNSTARTGLRTNIISEAPWIYVPYPFQFGLPTVSISAVVGMLVAVVASIIESVGDYYACARICDAPPPPVHAINRGVAVEGIGCILAGIWGTCNGTTSYSSNIGAIRITRVASRRVVQVGACLMIGFGIFGKFGALCATIPDPILAGVFIILFSMITAIGLSNLQLVDLNSPRNLFVLGMPIFFGVSFPRWISENKDAIQTGSTAVDHILVVLLSSPMLIGAMLGLILDNSIPGTLEERGLLLWRQMGSNDANSAKPNAIYDLPFGMDFIKRHRMFEKLPFSPTFRPSAERKLGVSSNATP